MSQPSPISYPDCPHAMIRLILILAASVAIISCNPPRDPPPERFSKAIAAYEAADGQQFPEPGAVLFVGSSSIGGWKTLEEDFPGYRVLNRGFGGSQFSDLNYYLDRVVVPYRPRAIIVYEGDNDIDYGKAPPDVLEDFKSFTKRVHREFPDTPILFISIKPSLARLDKMEEMNEANTLIAEYSNTHDKLTYVDVFTIMLDQNQRPREELFVADGLHLTRDAYKLWASRIRDALALQSIEPDR